MSESAPELVPLNLGWQRSTPFASLRRRARMISRIDVSNAIVRTEVPLVLGHGQHDSVVPVRLGRRLAKLRPDASLTVWNDGGHMQMLSHPERFAALASAGAQSVR